MDNSCVNCLGWNPQIEDYYNIEQCRKCINYPEDCPKCGSSHFDGFCAWCKYKRENFFRKIYDAINKFLTELCREVAGDRLVPGIKGIKGIKGLKGLTLEKYRRGLSVEQKNRKEN